MPYPSSVYMCKCEWRICAMEGLIRRGWFASHCHQSNAGNGKIEEL